ncbi:MAG: hypothetical protein U0165_08395 [Polyangiaceae bacterium]
MTIDERARLGEEILSEIGGVLFEHFAASEWGRILVGVQHKGDGELAVASIDVDELVGDERKVDAALGGTAIRAWLPALASAVDALTSLEEADIELLEGGTFVRVGTGGMAFLPGLVRAPSASFDRLRSEALEWMQHQNRTMLEKGVQPATVQLDLERSVAFVDDSKGGEREVPVVLLGSFSRAPRTWAWAFSNPSVPSSTASRCRAVVDRVTPRDMWEISTPQFATDEATCSALVAVVAKSIEAAGVLRFGHPDGLIYVIVERV